MGQNGQEPASTDQRLDQLEAVQAGLELLARVAQMIDLADPEGWLDCYTADGTFRFQAEPGGPDVFALVGTDALREWFIEHRARIPAGHQTHLGVNPRLTFDAERTKATSSYFTLLESGGSLVVASRGLWLDELVRCDDGQWRLQERCAVRVMPGRPSMT
jgi:SnoaL-like domain